MAFLEVSKLDELWVGEMCGLRLEGVRVLLLRTEDGVRAYEDRCPHLGVPLSEGTLSGGVVTCKAHTYTYDAATGHGINPRCSELVRLRVRVRDGAVLVDPASACSPSSGSEPSETECSESEPPESQPLEGAA